VLALKLALVLALVLVPVLALVLVLVCALELAKAMISFAVASMWLVIRLGFLQRILALLDHSTKMSLYLGLQIGKILEDCQRNASTAKATRVLDSESVHQ
jgi:hypothetical protein